MQCTDMQLPNGSVDFIQSINFMANPSFFFFFLAQDYTLTVAVKTTVTAVQVVKESTVYTVLCRCVVQRKG